MKIKRLKKIRINDKVFKIKWDKNVYCGNGYFDYHDLIIAIGIKNSTKNELFMVLSHELMEICACEMHVRYQRTDVPDDYLFSFDHRQFDTMIRMFSGLINQFIKR